jgi:hypothetical protein
MCTLALRDPSARRSLSPASSSFPAPARRNKTEAAAELCTGNESRLFQLFVPCGLLP